MKPLQLLSRHRRLAPLLAVVALAGFWFLYRQSAQTASSPAKAPAAVPHPTADSAAARQKAAGAAAAAPVPDVFAVRTWEPAQPAGNTSDAPAPPQAPPLPFRFLGKIADPEHGTAFLLTRGDQVLSINVGDTVDQTYRLEKYEGGQLYFLYQPMKVRQSLFVGSDS